MISKERKPLQINIRCTAEDLENLQCCQQRLGRLSQSDTLRLLMMLYLGKISDYPKKQDNTETHRGPKNGN